MNSHIRLQAINGESWIMHRDNIKTLTVVPTPDAFIEEWKNENVVLLTTTETVENEKGEMKPLQIMVGNTIDELEMELCGTVTETKFITNGKLV